MELARRTEPMRNNLMKKGKKKCLVIRPCLTYRPVENSEGVDSIQEANSSAKEDLCILYKPKIRGPKNAWVLVQMAVMDLLLKRISPSIVKFTLALISPSDSPRCPSAWQRCPVPPNPGSYGSIPGSCSPPANPPCTADTSGSPAPPTEDLAAAR